MLRPIPLSARSNIPYITTPRSFSNTKKELSANELLLPVMNVGIVTVSDEVVTVNTEDTSFDVTCAECSEVVHDIAVKIPQHHPTRDADEIFVLSTEWDWENDKPDDDPPYKDINCTRDCSFSTCNVIVLLLFLIAVLIAMIVAGRWFWVVIFPGPGRLNGTAG